MGGPVTTERSPTGVLRVSIDKPDSRNALDLAALELLGEAIAFAASSEEVRVVVVTGAGDHFSAGANLKEFAALSDDQVRDVLLTGQEVFRSIETLNKPVIARVDGLALGGGFELCLACTHILASDRARFALPEVKLGLMPGYGGTQRLVRSIGRHRALRVALGGQMVSAQEAWLAGLLSAAPVPVEELDSVVNELADQLLGSAPSGMAAVIRAMESAFDTPLDVSLASESEMAIAACIGPDGRKGVQAFIAKSQPSYHGIVTSPDVDRASP